MTDAEVSELRAALEALRATLAAQDGQIARIRDVQTQHAQRLQEGSLQLEEGAALMRKLDVKVTALTDATRPITDAMESMQGGIRIIGKIGRAGSKFGEWALRGGAKLGEWGFGLVKLGAIAFGIYVFVKAVLLGQPLASAWGDLLRLIRP